MDFSKFFIDRPIFAAVLSIVIFAAGLIAGAAIWSGGCTSGHGIVGNSRLSIRSVVATLTFMGAGFATVALVRALHV